MNRDAGNTLHESLKKREGDHIFVEAAPFADDIKMAGAHFQSTWHFN